MDRAIAGALERALGARVVDASRVSGGDIHDAWRVELADGRRVFVKSARGAGDPETFPCEARGLAWLGEGPLRVPRVLAVEPRFLALEWIERGRPARDADEALGRGLAALHRLGASGFGLDHDNFLATIRQDNAREDDWPTFYGRRRLEPLVRAAIARGASSPSMVRAVERVIAELTRLCGPAELPSRLHGDLWSGNRMHDEQGAPVLFDPAVYGGHREIDLAMMQLFGGFSERVFDAYDEAFPRAPGHEARVPLYQLLPLLAHAVLFGRSYAASAEDAARRALAG
ncbi:fructosamine kinase family protein [Sandaracinus amylolyticus]|uniref:Ribulosamine/erythrulosamine 3-kinase potentially in protein deglycation n=1 Tax=Sandaracinus amylolyticus TaxID=927083 RepID=A0A0F6W6N2_9BACT|nr:fructosamine kinase family protein [Sandaracinus amylolyticus]AKF08621.1 Ribulosamine/erythrulosamine 3-kinase potentially in protein deglycation [Sandaracinus amylolyticus]